MRLRLLRALLRLVGVLSFLTLLGGVSWWLWNPRPVTEQRFDRGRNGLWIGHQWYTGLNVRSREPVSEAELMELSETLERARIRYAYVHVGPLLASGGIEDAVGPLFSDLRRRSPKTLYLAWLGGIVKRLPLTDPSFRARVVDTIERLRGEGFDGVHLNIEPLEDHQPGYLELLREIRERLPREFLVSHATRRAGPFGIAFGPLAPYFWSESFYRELMPLTDQTVLMAYDTKMNVAKHYVAFVKHETELLIDWACEVKGHQVLIGIPSYEDVPSYSNPEIENIPQAVLGVRAALEELGSRAECFEGVAIYANWVTDREEWKSYHDQWLAHPEPN